MKDLKELVIEESTVEKAIQRGLLKLGLESKDVTVEILDEGKKGLFGFGSRNAKVRLTQLVMDPFEEPVFEQYESVENEVIEEQEVDEIFHETEEVAVMDDEEQTEAIELIEEDTESTTEIITESSNWEETAETVARYIKDICVAYGAPSEVTAQIEDHRIIFQIDSKKPGLIIGHHGKILDALQNLAQVMVFRDIKGRVSVLVNVADYREKREEILKRLAHNTARKVLDTNHPVILDPLPAFERKMIHAELSKNQAVKTHSEGKEPHRYLVVEPL
ncbi:RNA-binding cell elongation regulator Jag/EloR [Atopobacter phocae]|uniref:RNA-binding cell elongation regulator Jag/EloR n=1 Tax=Atopobacter phocae TaxID=136492 RepID=UPI00054E95F2|nr:RNA-binding cell elongation regulator Jag/EloR [Atopobacter phocae]